MNNLIKSQVLIDKYSDMIYRIAVRRLKNKEDAKDIVQEVLMKYVSAIYKGKEFETKDDEKYWLIRVAINTCNSQVRRLKFKRLLKMELNTITMVDTTSENIIEMMNIFEILSVFPWDTCIAWDNNSYIEFILVEHFRKCAYNIGKSAGFDKRYTF